MKNLVLNEKELRKKMIDMDVKTINELAMKANVSKPTIYEYIMVNLHFQQPSSVYAII